MLLAFFLLPLPAEAVELSLERHGVGICGAEETLGEYWSTRTTLADLATLFGARLDEGVNGGVQVRVFASAPVPEAVAREALPSLFEHLGYRTRGKTSALRVSARRSTEAPPPSLDLLLAPVGALHSDREAEDVGDGWAALIYPPDAGPGAPLLDLLPPTEPVPGLDPMLPADDLMNAFMGGEPSAVTRNLGMVARLESMDGLCKAVAPRTGTTIMRPEEDMSSLVLLSFAAFSAQDALRIMVRAAPEMGLEVFEAPGRLVLAPDASAKDEPSQLVAWFFPPDSVGGMKAAETLAKFGQMRFLSSSVDPETGSGMMFLDAASMGQPYAALEGPDAEERRRVREERIAARRERLGKEGSEVEQAMEAASSPTTEERAAQIGITIGENTVSSQRAPLCERLDDLSMVRVIPHRGPDGAMDGVRVSAIRRGSLAELLGIKNGDILLGELTPARSPWRAFAEGVGAGEEFVIPLVRRSTPLSLTYMIEGPACTVVPTIPF